MTITVQAANWPAYDPTDTRPTPEHDQVADLANTYRWRDSAGRWVFVFPVDRYGDLAPGWMVLWETPHGLQQVRTDLHSPEQALRYSRQLVELHANTGGA